MKCVAENTCTPGTEVYPTENKFDGIVSSVEQCASHCRGHRYFGPGNGGHDCSCSNTDPATKPSWVKPDKDCNTNCDAKDGTAGTVAADSDGETCGAPCLRTLYKFDQGEPTAM